MMVQNTIDIIKDIFNEIRDKFPCEAELDGEIYYMNGNDGTDFDWSCNGRLCEFMAFHENEMGYIKFCLRDDDTAIAYIYPDGGMSPTHKEEYEFPEGSARELAVAMYEACDKEKLWDKEIHKIDFSKATGDYDYLFAPEYEDMFEEEEEYV